MIGQVRLSDIASSFRGRGYEVVDLEGGGLEITHDYGDGGRFIIYAYETEAWIRLEALVLDEADLVSVVDEALFFKFVALLQVRLLGCRFGYDERGLFILADVYPGTGMKAVELVPDQLIWVWGCVKALFASAAEGTFPAEREIDEAFELRPPH